MSNWQELEKKYYMPTVKRVPVVIVKGKGAQVWDENGREYLDFVGGLIKRIDIISIQIRQETENRIINPGFFHK